MRIKFRKNIIFYSSVIILIIAAIVFIYFKFILSSCAEKEKKNEITHNFTLLDSLLWQIHKEKAVNNYSIAAVRNNEVIYSKYIDSKSDSLITGIDSLNLYDLASLTKVVATTTAVMRLYEKGKINIKDKAEKYFENLYDKVTVENLLAHNSGYPASINYKSCKSEADILDKISAIDVKNYGKTVYSDLNFIFLGFIVENITGTKYDAFCEDEIFKPLKMNNTYFNPDKKNRNIFIVPSESKLKKGFANDELARIMNGVSGNAGLFSTLKDLLIFVKMISNGGRAADSSVYLKKETIDLFTKTNINGRALGWDLAPFFHTFAGDYVSANSIGHTGFTGTSIYIDTQRNLFVILLSNSTFPDRSKKQDFIPLRREIHNLINKSADNYDSLRKMEYDRK